MLQNCKIDINYKDIKTKQIIVKIALVIMTMITKTSAEQITLTDLLKAYGIPYIILPEPEQNPVAITTTGKITHTTNTKQALNNQNTTTTLNTTEITTQIIEETAYIITPLPPPETINIEINTKKAPTIDYILKLLTDRLSYQWDNNILIIRQLWKLQDIENQTEETGTYNQLLNKALQNLKEKKNQTKPLTNAYTLLPMPEILSLCQLYKIHCIPITDDLIYTDDPEPIKTYLTQARPKIHIQAYILLLTDTAKQELNLSLNLLLSQARIPQFFSTQIKENTMTLNAQRGILNALELSLKALAEKNQASIIASPSLLLDDRQQASIRQGYEIPVITPATQTSPATATYRNAYLSLTVQPTLLPNNKIRINITLTKDSPDFSMKVAENIPIQTNAIQTTITVEPDTPILIGGVEEKINNNRTGLGLIFFGREKEDTKKELYILLIARTM